MTNDSSKLSWKTLADRRDETTTPVSIRVHQSSISPRHTGTRSEEPTARDHEPPDTSLQNTPGDKRVPPEVFLG